MNMHKISTLAAALLLAQCLSAQTTSPAPYCNAGYDDAGGTFPLPHFISNVTLGDLNYTSGNTQFPAPHYVYYNNIAAPDLMTGNTYNLSVTYDPAPSTIQYVAVFIDYNHNNSFNDPGERVLHQTTMSSTILYPSTADVTIPPTATPGVTRMRVMVIEDDSYSATHPDAPSCTADPTGYLDWGETEDYNVHIVSSTGVDELTKSDNNFLYPNPAMGKVHIHESFLGADISIISLPGKVVQQSKVSQTTLDISTLPPGTYLIRILNKGIANTQMLSVER